MGLGCVWLWWYRTDSLVYLVWGRHGAHPGRTQMAAVCAEEWEASPSHLESVSMKKGTKANMRSMTKGGRNPSRKAVMAGLRRRMGLMRGNTLSEGGGGGGHLTGRWVLEMEANRKHGGSKSPWHHHQW